MWESIHAPELGDQILEGIREDLLPAILKEAQVESESATMEAKVNELVEGVNWESLADAKLTLVVWSGEDGFPMFTFRADPRSGRSEEAEGAFKDLLRILSGWFEDSDVRREGARTTLTVESEGEELDWITLERIGTSIWITLIHTAEEALAGEGVGDRPGFSNLWAKGPDSVESVAFIDFSAISAAVEESLESMGQESNSSLVLDETMEALFKDDLETLEKLKQVESDMDFFTGENGESFRDPVNALLKDLASLGFLVSMSGSTEGGIENSTFWRLEPESEFEKILSSPPLTERFLTLIQPDLLRGSVYSLPDLLGFYQVMTDRIKVFPGGDDMLSAWDDIQE
ncbi:MAG: hypothetical protein KC931_24915, partial [Candidatus Omnitrophica bacterium]|nr:hypothetical protein [Candidatus Omnitrophota bacterium]